MTNLPKPPAGPSNALTPSASDAGESRTIKAVLDLSRPTGEQHRTVAAVLNSLTVPMLHDFRRQVAVAVAAGNPRFICANCGSPVEVRSNPASATLPADGRAAHFRHCMGAEPCAWRAPHEDAEAIKARKYKGIAEGAEHSFLKAEMADCIRRDARFSDIRVEKQVPMPDGERHRQPDVSAHFLGRPLAVDVQLSTASLKIIVDREADYRSAGYHHIWVVGPQIDRLSQKAFGDIHSNAGGRIFVIDPGSVAATALSGELHLRELSLAPRLAKGKVVHNVWTSSVVGTDVIMMSPVDRKAEGLTNYHVAMETLADVTFGSLRHRIRDNAAAGLPLEVVQREWNAIVAYLNGDPYNRAGMDRIGDVLAFLLQVEASCMDLTVETDAAMLRELQRRLDFVLKTWGWAPLVALVQQLVPALEVAMTPAQAKALSDATSKSGPSLMRPWRSMLAVLHPWLAYSLTARAPYHAPNLPGFSGTA